METINRATFLLLGLTWGFFLGNQESKPEVLTIPGGKVLALEVALKAFHKDKLLKTPYQKDLSHYKIEITETDNTFRISLDPGEKLDSSNTHGWLFADGIYETIIIDKKTMKLLRTEVVG